MSRPKFDYVETSQGVALSWVNGQKRAGIMVYKDGLIEFSGGGVEVIVECAGKKDQNVIIQSRKEHLAFSVTNNVLQAQVKGITNGGSKTGTTRKKRNAKVTKRRTAKSKA